MTDLQVANGNARHERRAAALSLFVSIIRQLGGTDRRRHVAAFKALLDQEGYQDFRDDLIGEWCRIKHSTALSLANPPTSKEMKSRQRQAAAALRRVRIDKQKAHITKSALRLIAPNGKRLGLCTGAECCSFGRLVRDVFNNAELAKLYEA